MVAISRRQVAAWRVRRHGLDGRRSGDPVELAGRLCGLHAQVMSSAVLTCWARLEDFEPDAIDRALWQDRTLVKTWAMRGTLHLLPTHELATWLGQTGTYDHYRKPAWLRAFGSTEEQRDALIDAIDRALRDRVLTREELAEAVVAETGREDLRAFIRGSWGPFVKPPAFQGKLCFGPSRGRNVCFTHPETWVGVTPGDPGPAIAARYLAAYGPVSAVEYAKWWATTNPKARALFEQLDLVEVERDGEPAVCLREHAEELAAAEPAGTVNLLGAFDQYVVGALNHISLLLPDPGLRGAVSRQAGWISPTLLVDGLIAGVWRHERKGKRLDVVVEPFGRVSARVRKAAGEEAERLARFLGGSLSVRWET